MKLGISAIRMLSAGEKISTSNAWCSGNSTARTFGRLSPLCPLLLNKTGQVREPPLNSLCLLQCSGGNCGDTKRIKKDIMIELNQCKANSSMCSWISLNFNVSFPDLNDATTINNRFCGYTSRIYPLQGQSSKAEASTRHTHPPNKHRLPPATLFPSGLRASSELPLLALQMSSQFMPYQDQQTCWALNLVDAICLQRSNFHVVHASSILHLRALLHGFFC